jgi:hypothetical protein
MFDPHSPLFLRCLSLFHGWLPILLFWLVSRLGYDRRALRFQTVAGTALLLFCYFAFVPPGTPGAGKSAVNLNFVFGLYGKHVQTMMPPLAWLAILIVGAPILLYWPTHLLLSKATVAKKKAATNRTNAHE